MKKLLAIFLIILLVIPVTTAVAEETAVSATMRLEKTEGTVILTNQSGTELPARNDSKLYSGYTMATELASYAYFGLDNKKVVKLDEVSSATVKKSGKKLELLAESGQLFFNVKEPLKADETLHVRTSNMVTGIRGTAGVVNNVDAVTTEFYLLDGTVSVVYIDTATGEVRTLTINAGEKAIFTNSFMVDGVTRATLEKRPLIEEEIPGFVAIEVAKDNELQKKIEDQTDLSVPKIIGSAEEKLAQDQAENKKEQNEIDQEVADRDTPAQETEQEESSESTTTTPTAPPPTVTVSNPGRGTANPDNQVFALSDAGGMNGRAISVTITGARKADGTSLGTLTDTFTLADGIRQYAGTASRIGVIDTTNISGTTGEIFLPMKQTMNQADAIYGTYQIKVTSSNGSIQTSTPISVSPVTTVNGESYATVESGLQWAAGNVMTADTVEVTTNTDIVAVPTISGSDILQVNAGVTLTISGGVTIDTAAQLIGTAATSKIIFGSSAVVTNTNADVKFFDRTNIGEYTDMASLAGKTFQWNTADMHWTEA